MRPTLRFILQCYCGLSTDQYSRLDDNRCNVTCKGDASQYCGGDSVISAHEFSTAIPGDRGGYFKRFDYISADSKKERPPLGSKTTDRLRVRDVSRPRKNNEQCSIGDQLRGAYLECWRWVGENIDILNLSALSPTANQRFPSTFPSTIYYVNLIRTYVMHLSASNI